jgi:hypothetical protein
MLPGFKIQAPHGQVGQEDSMGLPGPPLIQRFAIVVAGFISMNIAAQEHE